MTCVLVFGPLKEIISEHINNDIEAGLNKNN